MKTAVVRGGLTTSSPPQHIAQKIYKGGYYEPHKDIVNLVDG